MDVLKNIFGGGTPDDYERRAQRYQQGYQGGQGRYDDLDDDDVYDRYQRTLQHAPPEVVEQAHAEAFSRLPVDQRQQIVDQFRRAHQDPRQPFQYPQFSGGPDDYDPARLGRMAGQAQRQQPDLLQQVLGSGGALSNPMAKMAMAGVAAMAAQRMMGGQQGGGGGLLGNILGQR
jgi:hypothetical protein